jgi:hypothetical protein
MERRVLLLWGLAALVASCATKVPSVPDVFCQQDADCPSGVCGPDGRCLISCTGDGDCREGYYCDGHVCLPGPRPVPDAGQMGDGGMPQDDGGSVVPFDGGGPDGGSTQPDAGDVQCHEVGATRLCGPSQGTCVPGTQTCNGEFWGPCLNAIGPTAEECDGRDHDCDGVPNNRPQGCDCTNGEVRDCYNGPPDTLNVGTCRAGKSTCVDGRWGECVGAVEPRPNDCTRPSCTGGPNPGCECVIGQTDECYTGPAGTEGKGVCRKGTRTCIADAVHAAAWSDCTGQRLPEAEQCDGRDHDCNGTPNDPPGGCACQTGEERSCYGGPPDTLGVGSCRPGRQRCVDGQWEACTGAVEPEPGNCAVESCAGGPNPGCDCILGQSRPCYSGNPVEIGVGICQAGVQRCVARSPTSSVWGTCLNQRLPEAEQCDGLDHNCNGIPNDRPSGCDCQNGQVRSCYPGAPETLNVGTCRAGSQTCVDGRWSPCQNYVAPVPGDCSQLSCAGTLNPGCDCLIGQSQACYTGPANTRNKGVCHDGSQICVAVTGGSTWAACQGDRLPETEQCDNQDHDCNGVPNDPPGGCVCSVGQTQPCYTGPAGTEALGTCHSGTQECIVSGSSSQWGPCQNEVKPIPNDCDHPSCTGPNDPNPSCQCINGRTRSCYTGPAGTLNVGTCVGGTQTCASGQWGTTCPGQVIPAAQDLCVAPQAPYTKLSDTNCNNLLDRHNPVARPTAQAPGAVTITPTPSGFYSAIEVKPLVTITLSSGATDEDGTTTFTYAWRLVAAPANNTAGLSGAPGARPTDVSPQASPTLFAQLVGDYDVALVVTDPTGCQSAEQRVRIHVKPQSELLVQLKWNTSVDFDLELVPGEASGLFGTDACYWGRPATSWGATLDIDDLAGCNSENIALASAPVNGATFSILVHYYCNRRGHRTSITNPTYLCYETTTVTSAVPAIINIFVDGEPMAGGSFTNPMAPPDYNQTSFSAWWKPATLRYQDGIWYVTSVNQTGRSSAGCSSTGGSSTCVCGDQTGNAACNDPFCGPNGAGCRAQYNFSQPPPLCVP